MLYQNGYDFIFKYLSYNKVEIPIKNNNYIPTEIYKLNNEGEIELSKSNDIEISLTIDNQIEKKKKKKGPSLVKKFPYKK